MADMKKIVGLAERKDGSRRSVSITEREKDIEIIPNSEMEIMLAIACADHGLKLIEVNSISYV